ncbi:MAG: hypothetical protein VX278_10115 [Myxococcota bacterium]|nr:hypothetical protein [Myxococcota bacterium]
MSQVNRSRSNTAPRRISPTPQAVADFMNTAIPKRLNDDERTLLTEEEQERPRPKVDTKLSFGPEPDKQGFSEPMVQDFSPDPPTQESPVLTAPSIRSKQDVSNFPNLTTTGAKTIHDPNRDFLLDLVVIFCGNILALIGFVSMLLFRDIYFSFGLSLVGFGLFLTMFVLLSSRFGSRDGSVFVPSVLSGCMAVVLGFGYHMTYPNTIQPWIADQRSNQLKVEAIESESSEVEPPRSDEEPQKSLEEKVPTKKTKRRAGSSATQTSKVDFVQGVPKEVYEKLNKTLRSRVTKDSSIIRCFKQDSVAHQNIRVSLTLNNTGKISNVQMIEKRFRGGSLERCLQRAFANIELLRFEGDDIKIQYRF